MRVPVTLAARLRRDRHAARGAGDAPLDRDRRDRGRRAPRVDDAPGNLDLFRVGRVLEAEKHPNADRLQVTKVDVGEREPRDIVCGAWNFGVGATVGVALPGAVLPNGLKLDRREVRG